MDLFADLKSELAQRLGGKQTAVLEDAMEELRFADALAVLEDLGESSGKNKGAG